MSTIEKAAARLAARQKAGGASQRGPVRPAPVVGRDRDSARQEVETPAVGPVRGVPQGAAASGFCDIDIEQIHEKGYITPNMGRSQLAQEMRRIKRPLLLNIQKAQAKGDNTPPANLIMISSALPGEGKTFVAINLAMSMAAEVDRRVLLVDADVARGDMSRQLGIESRRGLSDLLQENSYLSEDGVLTTNIDRLSLLPAGSPSDNVDELFASGLMAVLTRALAEEDPNRVIIFDASPLLATTEAAVLAQRMGQTVLVVEANKTSQDSVAQALGHLEGCANVSVMLNKATGKDASGYSYGYGYGYADGPDDYHREQRRSEGR